jgi:hypothetical protein
METMDTPEPRRSGWKRKVVLAVVAFGGVVALYTWTALHLAYSRGERVGYVQKFAHRGWVCKTWEGELAIATVPGVAPEKFYFSTRSNPVAAQVNDMLGKRVRIRYDQYKFVPTTCFGDTEYFVAEAQPIDERQ